MMKRDTHLRGFEVNKHVMVIMYRMGVSLPLSAATDEHGGTLVRHVTMGKNIHFDQVATTWQPNRQVLWTYRFTKDSFPPNALDDHVRIGGRYFDVIDTEYTIDEIPADSTPCRAMIPRDVGPVFHGMPGRLEKGRTTQLS